MPTLIYIPTGYHGTSTIVVTPTVTLLFFHKKNSIKQNLVTI